MICTAFDVLFLLVQYVTTECFLSVHRIQSIEEDYDEVHLFSQEFCDQDSPSDSRSSSCRLSSSSSFKTSSSLCLGGEEGAREAGLRSSLLLDEEERY